MKAVVVESLVMAGMSGFEALQKAETFENLSRQLTASAEGPIRWFVPGRIEVLGKHTDYAGGRSLLCAAERGFCVAAVPRSSPLVRIHDVFHRRSFEFTISPDLEKPSTGWTVYPAVVARRLARNFPGNLRGAEIALASDLPSAAGMSSSSALVVAVFSVLSALNCLNERDEYVANIHGTEELAGYLGCIENGQTYNSLVGDGGVGTFGGSEDHTAILGSQASHLKQYAFCPVGLERSIKLPPDCTFVIAVSGVVANKAGPARLLYNRASQATKTILEIWRSISGFDDQTLAAVVIRSTEDLDRLRSALSRAGADSQWLLNRLEQFRLESEGIIPQAVDALARRDLHAFGELVDKSQVAAESLLGNQVPETISLTRQARALGAHAASAFGAGFGGSVWALVATSEAGRFTEQWREAYQRSSPQSAAASQFFITSAGPHILRL